jgi:hypothetical protein
MVGLHFKNMEGRVDYGSATLQFDDIGGFSFGQKSTKQSFK